MFSNLFDITGFFVSVLINLLLIALICYYFKRKIDNLEYSQSEQAKTLYTLLSQQNNMMAVNNETNAIVAGANDIMSGLDLTQLNQTSDEDNENDDNSVSDTNDKESDEEDDDESSIEEDSENDEQNDSNIQTIHMVPAEEEEEVVKQIEFANQSEDVQVQNNEFLEQSFVVQQDDTEGFVEQDVIEEEEQQVQEVNEVTEGEPGDNENENYEKMTVKELRNVLAEKGVHAKSSMNKSDIINILKGASNIDLEVEDSDAQ
jgi:hypothetical protein